LKTEQLIEKLKASLPAEREAVLDQLRARPPEQVIEHLADILLQDGASDLREACFELLKQYGAAASMEAHQTEGWFDRVKAHIAQFDEINRVLGDRFLAYSFILGIQIRALLRDAASPLNTAVHFTLNDEQVQTLSLGEFRLRVIQALLHDARVLHEPSLPFNAETALKVVGPKNILLAPLFDVVIEDVYLVSLDPRAPRYLIRFRTPEGEGLVELREFMEVIRAGLRQDLSGMAEQPFTIDLLAVQKAREAAESGDPDKVISLLASWPGLLSVLHRTPVARQLDDEQLALIGEGVCLLGQALEAGDRSVWSEELYKLGLQLVREGESAGRLCWNLGRRWVENGDFGMAIGLLRRALYLGMPEVTVLPVLGRAFLMRGNMVAAAALLETSSRLKAEASHLEADLGEVREVLSKKGLEWPAPLAEDGGSS
jgi:hypothetical protein